MENNLFLYEKRLKSHHDNNSLINKYIKSTPLSPKEFDEMLQKHQIIERKLSMFILHIVIKSVHFVI